MMDSTSNRSGTSSVSPVRCLPSFPSSRWRKQTFLRKTSADAAASYCGASSLSCSAPALSPVLSPVLSPAAASCPSWSKSWSLRVAPFRMKSRYRSDCAPAVLAGCATAVLAAASSRNHNGGRGRTDRVKFDVRCSGTVKLCGGLFSFRRSNITKVEPLASLPISDE